MRPSIVFAVLAFLTGCATIFNSGSQTVDVRAEPPPPAGGAIAVAVRAPGSNFKTTIPGQVRARPSTFSDLIVTIDDPCFSAQPYEIESSIAWSYWANAIWLPFGILGGIGVIGFALDPITGSMWNYEENATIPVAPVQGTGCQG